MNGAMAPVAGSSATAGPATALTLSLGPATVVFTGRGEGDFRPRTADVEEESADEVVRRRRAVVHRPWAWTRQVHGCGVVDFDEPNNREGCVADAGVVTVAGLALAVFTADCAPVALASPEGVVAVAHAGWSGLLAGVVGETVAAMRLKGASDISAAIGPCIRSECYQFGPEPLAAMVGRFGPTAESTTAWGAEALDLVASVRIALGEEGVVNIADVGVCTACSSDHYSWRARRDIERQAAVVWC